ncbi:MAG TPA: ABC transporter substrate-binding protein [Symbiobacteriaceae bacterium]|jgi:peptide/nickel transport system substrate-binding protein
MTRARKFFSLLAVLSVFGLLLSACGPKAAPAPQSATPTTPVAKKPAVGGQLNIRLEKDPDNFNPILSATAFGDYVISNVYARLFEFNAKWEPTPYVADSWSATPDGLTWTFNLHHGIKFHDGNELTADDVVFTLMSIKDKDYAGPRGSTVSPVKTITAKDKYTVVMELKEPYAALLTQINLGILEKKLFDGVAVKDFDKAPVTMNPIGAGPYKFKEYKRSQYVILERNPDWFMSAKDNGAPFIQTLQYKIVPDDTTAIASLENGELDVMWQVTPGSVGRLINDHKDTLVPVDFERNGWGYMTLNVSSAKLSDVKVRQALTYALDRKSIIDGAMDGRAVIPAGPIPPVSWAYDPAIQPLAFDPAKAKSLLDEAGWKPGADGIREKGGQKLKLTFYASSGNTLIEAIANIAKKNWKDIGVDIDVQLMDFNALMDNYLTPGKFDVTFSGFSLGLDPDSQYTLWHSSQIPSTPTSKSFNRGRYSNPDVDKLLEQGRRETDPAKRKTIYSDFQKKFVNDAPIILVYANKYTDLVSKKIKGGVFNMPGSGSSYIHYWWMNEQ